jgi:nicotinamide-nucleotide amidase
MEAIAHATQRPLTDQPRIAAQIRRFYARRHRRLQRAALRQAAIPAGGLALSNPLGTAPGLWLRLPRHLVVALPGVPAEMRAMLQRDVLPRLKRLTHVAVSETRVFRTAGLVELEIEGLLRRMRLPREVKIGLYPNRRAVDISLTAAAGSRRAAQRILKPLEARLRRALGVALYGTDQQTLEQGVGRLLVRRRHTLALAESCTGGLVADRLTDVPGSSRYVRGSVIAYHNDLKRLLGVPVPLLARVGAVSAPVAKAMAQGVRRMARADVGLAITGIAGPTGGSVKKPVGLVYFALADRHGVRSLCGRFIGDRRSVKIQAAQTALDWLRRYLLGCP